MWYVYDKCNKVIAYTEDAWYAAEMKRAGFDVREQRSSDEKVAMEKEAVGV